MGRIIDIKKIKADAARAKKLKELQTGFAWAVASYTMGEYSLDDMESLLDTQPPGSVGAFDRGARKALETLKQLKITDPHTKMVVDFTGEL